MAIDGMAIDSAAAAVVTDINAGHAEHTDAEVRTVGVLVSVEYTDAESGDKHTRTHYRFVHAPDLEQCPAYIALGLATQVANHIT